MEKERKGTLVKDVLDVSIRLALVAILAYLSYRIARPFLPLILWGGIIAIVLSPVVRSLEQRFGNRKKIVVLLTLAGIVLLVAPAVMLSDTAIESSQSLYNVVQEGTLALPPPSEKVRSWPVVGEKLYVLWESASRNLEATLKAHREEVISVAQWLLSLIGSGLGTVIVFLFSFIVAAFFLLFEQQNVAFSKSFFRRLVGKEGDRWAQLSAATVRSVVLGLVGIAVFQAVLSLVGLLVMDVPLAPVWAVLVLFVAIVQLPPLLVLGPIILYVFSVADTTPAVIFGIYIFLVSMSDAVLKPVFLGRGVAEIPTAIILVGAIGGMLMMGAIGLFLGAVALSLSYMLFQVWINDGEPAAVTEAGEAAAEST